LNAVANEPGRTAYAWRITQAGLRWPAKRAPHRCAVFRPKRRATGVKKNESLPWNLRDHALFIATRQPTAAIRLRRDDRTWRGSGAIPGTDGARHPVVAQQRDPAKMPATYPVRAAESGAKIKGIGT